MLSIREDRTNPQSVTLRLDGKLRGEWIPELDHLCTRHLREGRSLVLDVVGVQFVDPEGIALLVRLQKAGTTIVNRGLFLDLLLAGSEEAAEGRCSS